MTKTSGVPSHVAVLIPWTINLICSLVTVLFLVRLLLFLSMRLSSWVAIARTAAVSVDSNRPLTYTTRNPFPLEGEEVHLSSYHIITNKRCLTFVSKSPVISLSIHICHPYGYALPFFQSCQDMFQTQSLAWSTFTYQQKGFMHVFIQGFSQQVCDLFCLCLKSCILWRAKGTEWMHPFVYKHEQQEEGKGRRHWDLPIGDSVVPGTYQGDRRRLSKALASTTGETLVYVGLLWQGMG